jgi:hypothetical protein
LTEGGEKRLSVPDKRAVGKRTVGARCRAPSAALPAKCLLQDKPSTEYKAG